MNHNSSSGSGHKESFCRSTRKAQTKSWNRSCGPWAGGDGPHGDQHDHGGDDGRRAGRRLHHLLVQLKDKRKVNVVKIRNSGQKGVHFFRSSFKLILLSFGHFVRKYFQDFNNEVDLFLADKNFWKSHKPKDNEQGTIKDRATQLMDSGYWSPVLLDTEFHNNKNKTELICHWVESPDILIPPLTMVAHLNLVIVRVRSEPDKDIFWISNNTNYKSFYSGKILKFSVCDSIWLTYMYVITSPERMCVEEFIYALASLAMIIVTIGVPE